MDAATTYERFRSLYLKRVGIPRLDKIGFYNLRYFSDNFPIKFDKTHFIKDIMDDKFVLVIGPNFIIPSIYITMIKTFVGIVVDPRNDKPIDMTLTNNYDLFKNLDIGKYERFFNRNYGKHPVIHVCFQSIWNQSNNDTLGNFKQSLAHAFREHRYLLKSGHLNAKDKDLFEKYLLTNIFQYLTEEDIENGLKVLSNILYKHFRKEIFLIIEHYDAPVLSSLCSNTIDTQRCIKITRNLYLNTFSKNDHVGHALVTGVCHITDLGIATIKTSKVYNFLQKRSLCLNYQKEKSDIGRFIVHDIFQDDRYKDFFCFNDFEKKCWLKERKDIFKGDENGLTLPYLFPLKYTNVSNIRIILERLFETNFLEVTFTSDITTDRLGRLKKCLMCNNETDKTLTEQTHLFLQLLCNMGCLNCTSKSDLSGDYCVSVPEHDHLWF